MPATNRLKLTKSVVDRIKPGDRDTFVWDAEIRGFGLRVKPPSEKFKAGTKSWIFQYRRRGEHSAHNSRRHTIGTYPPVTPDEARTEAHRLKSLVLDGRDPARDRQEANASPTVANLMDRYLTEYARTAKKPRSIAEDERNIDNHVKPSRLAKLRVRDVTRQHIVKLHQEIGKTTPIAANRVLALLSRAFALAEDPKMGWGYRPVYSNPCAKIDKFPEIKRQRYLSVDELQRLGAALADAERDGMLSRAIAAIRLLLLTGCRKSEIVELEWPWIDFDRRVIHLPDSKTGQKTVFLNAPALAVLAGVPRDENETKVFASVKGERLCLDWFWRIIRAKAKLPDVRIHDLRHSFASVLAGMGEGLLVIGKVLGHSNASTTERYAHLTADRVQSAADRAATKIAALMAGTSGEIIPMARGGQK